jgi:hypothetical protein
VGQLAAGKGERRYQHQPAKDQLWAPDRDHQANGRQHEERKITQRRKVPGLAEGAGSRGHPQGDRARREQANDDPQRDGHPGRQSQLHAIVPWRFHGNRCRRRVKADPQTTRGF